MKPDELLVAAALDLGRDSDLADGEGRVAQMNPICAECGAEIPRLTLCWLVHLPPTPAERIRTKTVCADCHGG